MYFLRFKRELLLNLCVSLSLLSLESVMLQKQFNLPFFTVQNKENEWLQGMASKRIS